MMEEKQNNAPTAERILSLLVDLLADQHGVKVKYRITTREKEERKGKKNGCEADI